LSKYGLCLSWLYVMELNNYVITSCFGYIQTDLGKLFFILCTLFWTKKDYFSGNCALVHSKEIVIFSFFNHYSLCIKGSESSMWKSVILQFISVHCRMTAILLFITNCYAASQISVNRGYLTNLNDHNLDPFVTNLFSFIWGFWVT